MKIKINLKTKKLNFRFFLMFLFLTFTLNFIRINAQIEHINVNHPVYSFLQNLETKGLLEHFSLSVLPLQKKEIVEALNVVKIKYENNNKILSKSELDILYKYIDDLSDYKIEKSKLFYKNNNDATIFYSDSLDTQLFSAKLIEDGNKYVYFHKDSKNNVQIKPLGLIDIRNVKQTNSNEKAIIVHGGFRVSGTLTNNFGFNLQATNGTLLSGSKQLALEDPKLNQNVKFDLLNSDIDFTESHVRYDNDWFYASIGRETRLSGAGLNQRLFISDASPATDALTLGARFSNFEYRFSHASLLGISESEYSSSVAAKIPAKYSVSHRFAFKPSWGEVGLWENLIYSDRYPDLAYLNPLSFYKSLEHALRDRDNSMMGFDFTIRPIDNLQIKASYLLDDLVFNEIGTGYWSNKAAWNIAILTSFIDGFELGAEYTRIEPYTFSHYNYQNSYTNDGRLYGSIIPPNSDLTSLVLKYWWGERYPLKLTITNFRHGENILDQSGNLVTNVGSDPFKVFVWGRDKFNVTFLEGNQINEISTKFSFAYEFIRNFTVLADLEWKNRNTNSKLYGQLRIMFDNF